MTQAEVDQKYRERDPWKYESTSDDMVRRARIVSAIRERPKDVLDLGCGEGFISSWVPFQRRLVIVDMSREAVNRALVACANEHATRREKVDIRPICADIFGDLGAVEREGPYDLVMATGVLYGASEAEISRLMLLGRPGGRFLSSHIQDRPHQLEYLRTGGPGWSVEIRECFKYREFMQELLVLRRPS